MIDASLHAGLVCLCNFFFLLHDEHGRLHRLAFILVVQGQKWYSIQGQSFKSYSDFSAHPVYIVPTSVMYDINI